MKRVLIIGMTEGIGGVETFICNLKRNISKDIHIDFLVHQDIKERYLKDILSNNSKIYKVTGIKKGLFRYLKDIFSFYKKHNYDVVHINECDAKMFLYALPLLFEKKTKIIVHSHSTNACNFIVHKIITVFQNKRANVKWACSNEAFEYMFGKKEKKHIIHNGIDLNYFKFDEIIRETKRKQLGLKDELVFCSIARFTEEKNHKKIIDIFKEYNNIDDNIKLLLVGVGPLQNEIIKKVEELNLKDKVLFLNSRTDISEILSAVDIFLIPSIFEGIPFVTLEAQACSVMVFASENVSREISITDLVVFLNNNLESREWARKIKQKVDKKINKNSTIYHKQLSDAGYDIKKVCSIVEEEYRE